MQQQTFQLVDEINAMVAEGRRVPLSNLVMVDRGRLAQLLQELEDTLPTDLNQARNLLMNEASIINDARAQAESMMTEATTSSRNMVDDANRRAQATVANADAQASETVRAANEKANATLADAEARARNMVEDAEAHAAHLVSETEIVARAQAQAQEMLERAQQEVAALRHHTFMRLNDVLETADAAVSDQLGALRALRQEIAGKEQQ